MVMAMRHEQLPPTLHADEPSPHVDWTAGAVELLTEPQPWARNGRPRRAGVSSFGVSGTNAHLVLEEPPAIESRGRSTAAARSCSPRVTRRACVAQARKLRAFVAEHAPDLADLGFSLATGRAHHAERAAIVAHDAEGLLGGLDALIAGRPDERVLQAAARSGRTVFVFPGQGSQWEGMAAELLRTSPVFAASIEACETGTRAARRLVAARRADRPRPEPGARRRRPARAVGRDGLARRAVARPRRRAAAVIGHSQGEIAAAYVAGALSLDDAARVVALRSQAIAEELAGQGGMASIALDVDTLQPRLPDGVSVAAVNGPRSVVVAGEDEALDALLEELHDEGVWVRRIPVDYPSHSPAVELLEARLLADLGPIAPVSGAIPFYSTLDGRADRHRRRSTRPTGTATCATPCASRRRSSGCSRTARACSSSPARTPC